MNSDYAFIAETPAFITSIIPMMIHIFIVLCEVSVATFMGIQGLALLIDPEGGTPGQARWGRLPLEGPAARPVGGALLAAGLMILAPGALGVTLLLSLIHI